MGDRLPNDPLPPEIDQKRLQSALEIAFEYPSRVSALVVVYKGRLVAEQYAPWASKDTRLENWSMGKSLTATLIGRLMHDGHFNLDDRAPLPEWDKKDDPRRQIRIRDLMRMSSGLNFTLHEVLETTADGNSIIKSGYPDHFYIYSGAIDAFRYVVTRSLQYKPNTIGRYRNTDPLTLGYIVKRTVESLGQNYLKYPQRALFDEIGIRDLVLETDPYGNFLSSGYELGKARDWARLGLLYLQDGVWQGKRLLPDGFVDFVRTPAPAWNNEEGDEGISRYGGLWWLNTTGVWDAPSDSFYASGAGGQTTLVIPSRDLVIVRLTDYEDSPSMVSKTKTEKAIKAILESIEIQ
jgi:CubicO group peptidase (beta-lactamase class C family)